MIKLFGENLFYACESYSGFILTVTVVSGHPSLAKMVDAAGIEPATS